MGPRVDNSCPMTEFTYCALLINKVFLEFAIIWAHQSHFNEFSNELDIDVIPNIHNLPIVVLFKIIKLFIWPLQGVIKLKLSQIGKLIPPKLIVGGIVIREHQAQCGVIFCIAKVLPLHHQPYG